MQYAVTGRGFTRSFLGRLLDLAYSGSRDCIGVGDGGRAIGSWNLGLKKRMLRCVVE
jgi:hypothetical protein